MPSSPHHHQAERTETEQHDGSRLRNDPNLRENDVCTLKRGGDDDAKRLEKFGKHLAGGDVNVLIQSLAEFDQSVAAQVAGLWHSSGMDITGEPVRGAVDDAPNHVQAGFRAYAATLVE